MLCQGAAENPLAKPCQAIVTYNGKAFDIPLLTSRYTSHGWRSPFPGYAHIDLLHLSRRLWRDRLPSRTLGNIEVQILGASRSEEDVPGWMIPQMYFDFLRSGDATPLRSVFYHNAMDVTSLAALLNHTAGLIADPLNSAIEHVIDLVSLARLHEDLGDTAKAVHLYTHALHHLEPSGSALPQDIYLQALERLAAIYKRSGESESAINLWVEAAKRGHLPSHVELAKYYEHTARDYAQARQWTMAAIGLVRLPEFDRFQREIWLVELEHRLDRLQRKLSGMRA